MVDLSERTTETEVEGHGKWLDVRKIGKKSKSPAILSGVTPREERPKQGEQSSLKGKVGDRSPL